MNSKCLKSFTLSLLFVSLSAYSDFGSPYVGVGYGNQGIYIGNDYVGFGNQGYVNYGDSYYGGYGTGVYGTEGYGNNGYYGTTGYNQFAPSGYSNPDYRQLRTWSNGDYYGNVARGQGSSMIYEQPYHSATTNTNDYSCTVVPGHFDAVSGNWVSANSICVSQ